LTKFLQKAGVRFEVYANGGLLISRLEELNPSEDGMVVTDIEMPGTDGNQVASFIKNNSKYSHIPEVVNSCKTTDAVRGKMNQYGV
ncbi:chemotaxis protein CheV, partial [Aliarcobacter butzleri]